MKDDAGNDSIVSYYLTVNPVLRHDTSVVITNTNYPEGILYRFTITLVQESES